ncbi:MAG: 1-(5-phosphoribosyl)-5-[(5-phosphoribosylamino)methylideneamino]imidazole-4-carboxamide isomerase [Oscillospiraceae bacterium]|nr:1-(5-phosphoribosyl)-5-[(5-phosphoribosylamino)methylideneamino]imidazole-4-carboxamide isomerase [Oscillospiraceae bacterium]
MTIYPAIDLFEGKAVRLKRGDYERMTVYSDDPPGVARGFRAQGAVAVHVVDLQGARDGSPVNFDTIERIVEEFGQFVQVGGGIRAADTVEKYLSIGVKRVILGTAAVSAPGFLKEMIRAFGDAIAVSVDIKDGCAAIAGWTQASSTDALEFCDTVAELGVRTLICTDISKDGMLGGTNMELYATLREKLPINIIASGGITTLDEIASLSERGIDGAILGRSIYTGSIKLPEAIMAARKGAQK